MFLKVGFSEVAENIFKLDFSEGAGNTFGVNFGEIQTNTEYLNEEYEGEYTIIPKVITQKMSTRDKVMIDDVTIEAIPYAEVTNISNGKTVTIG